MLTHWYQQSIGQRLFAAEMAWLAKQLPSAFGYYLLQIGHVSLTDWLTLTSIPTCLGLDAKMTTQSTIPIVVSDMIHLPFASDSLDVILLVHALEFSSDPIALLTEVERCLMPEGRLLILSFNAASLWQLWQSCRGLSDFPKGHFIRPELIKKALVNLHCEIEQIDSIMQRPPIQSQRCFDKLAFLEHLGQRFWPQKAGCYGISAIKRVNSLTPIRPKWRCFYDARTKAMLGQQRSTWQPQQDSDNS